MTIELEALDEALEEEIHQLAAFCNFSTHFTTRRPNYFRSSGAFFSFGRTSFDVLVVGFSSVSFVPSFWAAVCEGRTQRQ